MGIMGMLYSTFMSIMGMLYSIFMGIMGMFYSRFIATAALDRVVHTAATL